MWRVSFLGRKRCQSEFSCRLDGREYGVGMRFACFLRCLMWIVREGVVKLYDVDVLILLMLSPMLAAAAFACWQTRHQDL